MEGQKNRYMKRVSEFLLINLGLFLVAAGIHFFKVPNKFATGGVSAMAIVLSHFFPNLAVGPLMLIINAVFLVIAFFFIGFSFVTKTLYSSIALSGMVSLLGVLIPLAGPVTGDTMLELVYSIILPGLGSALVFNMNASTGGTDILAKLLNKYTNLDIGKALLSSDFIICIAAGLVYGPKIGMYSLLGLITKAFLIDTVLESFNMRKQVVIVSDKSEEIKNYVINNIKRGATIHTATGAFTNEEKHVITTIMTRKQALDLRNFIKQVDKNAFITMTNSSEIIGKGFRSI